MRKVILDSDLLSDLLKGVNLRVVENFGAYQLEHVAVTTTSMSALEILSGLKRINATSQLARAERLFAENEEIVPDLLDYRLASDIVGSLWRTGTPIGLVDPMIAACAIRRGFGVGSANTAHFEFIRKLGYSFHLENWREPLDTSALPPQLGEGPLGSS